MEYNRKVTILNIKTLKEIELDGIKEAEKFLNTSGVRNCLSGKNKTCNGWLVRYSDSDFSKKAKEITNRNISVYKAVKDGESITLPLGMLSKEIEVDKASILYCATGERKRKTAKGYTIEIVDDETKNNVLDSISYIEYLKGSVDTEVKNRRKVNNNSLGEGLIENILKHNNIQYAREVELGNTKLIADFIITKNDNVFVLEYNGRHHYEKVNGFFGGLETQKERDLRKKEYCKINDINYIEIEYKMKLQETMKVLENNLGNLEQPKEVMLSKNIKVDVQEFKTMYQYMTALQLSKVYDCEEYDIKAIVSKLGITKRLYKNKHTIVNILDKKSGSIVDTGSIQSMSKKYNLLVGNMRRVLNKELKTTGGYKIELVEEY